MDFFRSKLLTIVLVLCLVFTIIIGVTANKKISKNSIQSVVSSVAAPVQKYVYMAGQRISNVFYFLSSLADTRKENIALKEEIDGLNNKLIDYDKYKSENDELESLLALKNSRSELKYKAANVIGKIGDNWFDMFILDVGENDGVKKGEYVVNGQGLVGQVFEVSKSTCKVMNILDDGANIPAKISSTGEDGMVSGISGNSNEQKCKINYLTVDTKASAGNSVVTSNIVSNDNIIIPSDILIGTIEKVEDDKPNLSKIAYIKPAVNFSKVNKVMVIIK